MGAAAAKMVARKIHDLLKGQDRVNMVFAAAPSQHEFLLELKKQEVDWTRINGFHMDEYVGLEPDAPQSFGNFLKQNIFGKCPFNSVYYLTANPNDIQESCQQYQNLLRQHPPDIVCMGIGENGHIAFNDPHVASFTDSQWVKMVELDMACRQQQVHDGCFAEINEVPQWAITLTIPALMQAPFIYCMVPGQRKATAVFNTLRQPVLEAYPSTILRTHENAFLFLDEDSSRLLGK